MLKQHRRDTIRSDEAGSSDPNPHFRFRVQRNAATGRHERVAAGSGSYRYVHLAHATVVLIIATGILVVTTFGFMALYVRTRCVRFRCGANSVSVDPVPGPFPRCANPVT